MGASELIRILISLVGAAMALGVAAFALRLFKWDWSRLPPKCVPPIITLFMMVASVTLLITLEPGRSATARGAGTEDVEPDLDTTKARIQIYPFESWGEQARRNGSGPEFCRVILADLRERNLNARKGLEADSPVGLLELDKPPVNLIEHYRKIAPFMSITGYVSVLPDGRLEATTTVSWIDRSARSHTILEDQSTFRESPDALRQAATTVADEIAELASMDIDIPAR